MSSSDYPFASHAGFLRAPGEAPGARFGVAGIAYDGATTNRPGARFGPAAIRRASHMLCDAVHPLWDIAPGTALVDFGDLDLPTTSLASLRVALETAAPRLIGAHHMCWLGGDHSVTLSLLRAYRQVYGQALALVHFDAHCDTWEDHFGEPSGHGTWVREAYAEELIVPQACIQIGIRSPAARADREFVRQQGGAVHEARALRGAESAAQLHPIIEDVRERVRKAGSPPLYLTLDIDCLDPAFAPGTGTPEVAGLSSAQLATLIEGLVDLPFVGMDCVEVAPAYDHAELTSLAAAQMVWTYLCARLAHADSAELP